MKNKIFIIILLLVLGIITGCGVTTIVLKDNYKTKTDTKYKESPYTLDEIYYLVEHPEKFAEENKQRYNELAYIINHFYEYFNEYTPVKRVRLNYEKMSIESIEYMDYTTYMVLQKDFYKFENEEIKACKEENKTYKECLGINNRMWADRVVYGDEIYRTEFIKKEE